MDRRLRFLLLRAISPFAVLAAPIFVWRERRMMLWADKRLIVQLGRMRELVRVAENEQNPNYYRDLKLAVARYRGAMKARTQ